MTYKLVALDLDGTIRSDEHPISKITIDTIRKLRERGAIVTIATGRTFASAMQCASDLGITAPIVSFQGALVSDPVTGQELWKRELSASEAIDVIESSVPWGMHLVAYVGHDIYVTSVTAWVRQYAERNGIKTIIVDDLRSVAVLGVMRILAVGDEDVVALMESTLRRDFGERVQVTRSLPHFCEILAYEAGKDKALSWLCHHMGISENETIAFGNGYNDVDMVSWAGLGVAVRGAVREVLDVADLVAPRVEEDGPAEVLNGLVSMDLIGDLNI